MFRCYGFERSLVGCCVFWDARNIKKDGEFMGIVLLLLDEKCSIIHGFIPAARAEQFRNVL